MWIICNCFLFLCSIIFFIISSSAADRTVASRPKGLVLPVLKDKWSHQYITQINQGTPLKPIKLLVELGGRFMWVDCDKYVSSSYKPVKYGSALCKLADSHGCSSVCYDTPKIGCSNNTCCHLPYNPVVGPSSAPYFGDLGQDFVSLKSIGGRNVSVPNVPFGCSSGSMLENFADGVVGIAGVGRSNVSLPAYFSSALGIQRKFAICLSNLTNSSGVIFFGDAPYSSDILTYTPLIHNPASTAGIFFGEESSTDYFIAVKTIRVGGKEIKFNKTLLSIDGSGRGGTRISTIHPYTVLHTCIYKALLKTFVKQMKVFISVFSVNPPIGTPFDACFLSDTLATNEYGPSVPFIDLVLESQESVYWRIWGSNSLVQVNSQVMCLGFVDGGLEPASSIIIGGSQLENNLLQFDLASSTLGFTSSLLVHNTTCSKFNAKSV